MIAWIRHKHGIRARSRRRPEELTVQQVAQQFRVSHHVVYYWIDRQVIQARQEGPNQPYWITLTPEQESELTNWIKNSHRIGKPQNHIPNAH